MKVHAAAGLIERLEVRLRSSHRWTELLADEAKRNNVVVIVPSQRRANEWEEYADGIFRTSTIHQAVESLRAGHVGLVVLINRYDGIDLPGKACRQPFLALSA